MGIQIQCAQCHDHKTDKWKRQQFHEFAAFFSGVGPTRVEAGGMGQLPVFAVTPKGNRRYFMPDKDNPQKQIPIAPRFFLTTSKAKEEPALPDATGPSQRRERAASYITGQDNPWFAKAYINRIWYVLMGESFYEPIDDIGPERTPKGAEVLDPLADQWQKGGYDVRWLFRIILNTEAYQRRVRSTNNAAGKTPFASSCPSRLRADQVFDALVQALALPTDSDGNLVMPANPKGGPGKIAAANKKAAASAGLASQAVKKEARRPGGVRAAFDRLFGVDPSVRQRRRHGHDPPGSVPDERRACQQSRAGAAGNRAWRSLDHGAQRTRCSPCSVLARAFARADEAGSRDLRQIPRQRGQRA